MMLEHWYAIASVALVSLISLAGLATFALDNNRLKKLVPFLLSLAAGAMLGNALLHLLPESIADLQASAAVTDHHGHDHHGHDHSQHDHDAAHDDSGSSQAEHHGHRHNHAALGTAALVLAGIFAFFGMDLLLHKLGHCCQHGVVKPVGWLVLVGDGLENLIDGMAIGAAYLVSIPAGIATTVAVLIHELPVEFGDFGVLLHAGFSRGRALMFNFLSALAAFVGCGIALTVGASFEWFIPAVAPLAAGAFIYLAASSLLPAAKQEFDRAGAHFLCVLAGAGIMALLLFLH